MTINTDSIAPIAAETETAMRQLAAGASLQARAEALELAAASLADNRDSSVWEILYAAEWILGDFAAATSWEPVDATGAGQ